MTVSTKRPVLTNNFTQERGQLCQSRRDYPNLCQFPGIVQQFPSPIFRYALGWKQMLIVQNFN